MSDIDWVVGVLLTAVLLLTVWLFRLAFGIGDRKREREELRRSAKRAEPE